MIAPVGISAPLAVHVFDERKDGTIQIAVRGYAVISGKAKPTEAGSGP